MVSSSLARAGNKRARMRPTLAIAESHAPDPLTYGLPTTDAERRLVEEQRELLAVQPEPEQEEPTIFGGVYRAPAACLLAAAARSPASFVFGGASVASHAFADASLPFAAVLRDADGDAMQRPLKLRLAAREYATVLHAVAHPALRECLSSEARRRLRAVIVMGGPQVITMLHVASLALIQALGDAPDDPDHHSVVAPIGAFLATVDAAHTAWSAAFSCQAPARLAAAGVPRGALAAAARAAHAHMTAHPRADDGASFGHHHDPRPSFGPDSRAHGRPLPPHLTGLPAGAPTPFVGAGDDWFSSLRPGFGARGGAPRRGGGSMLPGLPDLASGIKGRDLPMRRLMLSYQRRGMTGSGTSRVGGPAKYVSLAGAPLMPGVKVSAKALKRGRDDGEGDEGGGMPDASAADASRNLAPAPARFGGLESLASAAAGPGSADLPVGPPPALSGERGDGGWDSVLAGSG